MNERIPRCDTHFMERDDRELEYLRPTGYVFLTNIPYGINEVNNKYSKKTAMEEYSEYIARLHSLGYIVQVTDAVDYKGRYLSTPLYQHIAIYVRKEDGSEVNKLELFDLLGVI